MKASGISLFRIMRPLIWLMGFVAVGALFLPEQRAAGGADQDVDADVLGAPEITRSRDSRAVILRPDTEYEPLCRA